MKFLRYNEDSLGLLTEDETGIIDLTEPLELTTNDPLKEYLERDLDARPAADREADHRVEDVTIDAPVRRPGKVVAAPGNYLEHLGEVPDDLLHPDQRSTEEEIGYFLKAPSSVVGPSDGITLPYTNRRCDHEIELAFVMENEVKNVAADDVWDDIFGYTILLDISVRGKEDRSSRKSYDTFTPLGPVVVTTDEIDDPHDLQMELKVNGETRQNASTREMINTCAEIVENAAIEATVEAGDVVTTGTPSGVGPLAEGDTVHAEIEGIGRMELTVTSSGREDPEAGD